MRYFYKLSHCPIPKDWDSGTPHRTGSRGHRPGKEQAMFSLRSNVLLCEAQNSRLHGDHSTKRGGRSKGDPCAARCMTIGVRVNAANAGRISVDSGLLRDILLAIAVLQRGLLGVGAKEET